MPELWFTNIEDSVVQVHVTMHH